MPIRTRRADVLKKVLLFSLITVVGAAAAAEHAPRTLFLAGDSTLDEHGGDESRYASWGSSLRKWLKPGMRIVNYAKSGRSTKSFRTEGWWDRILDEVRPGDFVLIEFGHNDQKLDQLKLAVPQPQFRENLMRMIREVRQRKGMPYLATPIVRLTFEGGRLCDPEGLDGWAERMRETAKEANVPLVDMRKLTYSEAMSAGEAEALTWNAGGDRTHPALRGARLYAKLFHREVFDRKLDISRIFIPPIPHALTLRPGGSVRLPDDPEGFVPMLRMDGTMLTAVGRTDATDRGVRYDFIKSGEVWAKGGARLEKTEAGVRATWVFVPVRPAAKVEVGTVCSLDVGRFPPESYDVRRRGQVRIRDLVAKFSETFTAKCADGRWAHPWHSAYNIRISAPPRSDVSAGEKLVFALDFAARRPLEVAFAGTVVADERTGWVRMDHLKDIRSGSALDFSELGLQDAPAGKYGWLKMSGDRLLFEKAPDRPQRLCGVNFCGEANYPETVEEAERRAERMRRLGYNALRIHHHDNLFAHYENGRLVLDAENADRLDRLVAACIRRGIYLTTDLYVSRRVAWKDIGIERPGKIPMKVWQLVTERGWQDWCDYARLFMCHRNPYTGRTYAEEPAMPFVCIKNESAFFSFRELPEQKELWGMFLREARKDFPGAFPGFSPDELPAEGQWWDAHAETAVKSAFWAFLERRFVSRATRFLREELGVKAFLTGDNFGPTPAFVQKMRSDVYGYCDAHMYETGWWEWLGKGGGYARPMKIRHLNPLQKVMPPENLAFSRIWGLPWCVSEWDYIGPDSRRSSGGLIFGSIAAIQGWNGIWRFAYEHGSSNFDDNRGGPELYNLARDPLKLASDRVSTLLYLRGDMPEARETLSLDFGEAALDPRQPRTYKSAPDWTRSGVAFSHRVGVSVCGRGIPPGTQVFAQDKVGEQRETPLGVALPDAVALDRIRGTFAVNTLRTIGVYSPEFGSFAVGENVIRTSDEATVFVSALKGDSVATASRILITHLTDALARGSTYMDDAAHVWLEEGCAEKDAAGNEIVPVLLKPGTAELALKLDRPNDFVAYALESDGRRATRLDTAVANGRLIVNLSVAQPFGGCMLYELVRE